jgi:hypothetical protein
MEYVVMTHIISETDREHICHASTCIWKEDYIVNIRCDDLVYETREIITPITSSQEYSIYSVYCSDGCDRALGRGRDGIIVEGDITLGSDSL